MVQQESVRIVQENKNINVVYSDTIPSVVEQYTLRNTKEEAIACAQQELNELFGADIAAEQYSVRVTYFAPKEHIRLNPDKYTDPENWRGGYSVEILDKNGKEVESSELLIRHYLVQQLGANQAFKINIEIKDAEPILTDQHGNQIPNDFIKTILEK